ncbi:potassium channel family protein [Marinomonas algicola]|uniref:potassium channel family protein n=1 Tax=Marinomonas algicola TaxID=2773454 RepID=UPI0017498A4A|nr:potassium channel family protein [Marinomonas algicola]
MMSLIGLLKKNHKKRRQDFKHSVYLHAAKDLKFRFMLLAGIILLHSLAMVMFEEMDWWQAFWLSMTSASTTGYGDISAATIWGQAATIILIYGVGIALLAQIASDYIELRLQKKEMRIKGNLEWDQMQDHLLIVNTPKHYTERYLERLISQICDSPELQHTPIQILTPHFPDGLPMSLRAHGVVHHTGDATTTGMLESAGAQRAKYIIVLSPDSQESDSDSKVFDILHRLKELSIGAFVLAEAVEDANRDRFRDARADAVIRPIRAYPEMLVRSLIAPGTEQVLEDLFRYQGDHTIRLDVEIKGKTWADIVTTLIQQDIGTALGYVGDDGMVTTHPKTAEVVNVRSLIILVNDDQIIPNNEIIKNYFQ